MPWEFATAGRIVFGAGARRQLPEIARALGRRPLLVAGRHASNDESLAGVDAAGRFMVEREPSLDIVRSGVEAFRSHRCDLVIGAGGGSALDTAKAIAALAPNSGEPLDYLEVIGRGQTLELPPAPCIAIPTTAGTGSEVTRNAVVGSHEHGVKASLRHPGMLPRVALVDAELTLTLPAGVTITTGLDALTQLIEPFVSPRATPLTDALCLEGIPRISRSIRTASSSSGSRNLDARTDMVLASLFGGLALANAGLGVVHGFAAPLGAMFSAPHGAICAALLPHGMRANLQALRRRAAHHPSVDRYRRIAVAMTGVLSATADDGLDAVATLCGDLGVAGLRTLGVGEGDADEICRKAAGASSMKANPIVLTHDELRAVLMAAL
jgi:alcohol dehydrogenase class IV